MINKKYVILCAVSAFVGLLLFAYQKEYLIINFSPTNHASVTNSMMEKKNITLHYWHQNKWNTEQVSLLFSENNAANMQQLVSRWLQLINEEEISKKKVQLQSAAITYDTQELIISFDRTPWNKEISTFEKWMIFESLLKTIRSSDASLKRMRLLVNQQLPLDQHLDFTNAWPIEGFQSAA